jgi:serine/threonine protein phosphatase PrpC
MPSEIEKLQQISEIINKPKKSVTTKGIWRERNITIENVDKTLFNHKLKDLSKFLFEILDNNKDVNAKQAAIETSEKLLKIYEETDPFIAVKTANRKALQKKVQQLNREILNDYLKIESKGKVPIHTLAKKLLEKRKELLNNPETNSAQYEDLIKNINKLLNLYKTEGRGFNVFGRKEILQLRQIFYNPPLNNSKTSSIFSRIFPQKNVKIIEDSDRLNLKEITSILQDQRESAKDRQNLNREVLTELEVCLHLKKQGEISNQQLSSEKNNVNWETQMAQAFQQTAQTFEQTAQEVRAQKIENLGKEAASKNLINRPEENLTEKLDKETQGKFKEILDGTTEIKDTYSFLVEYFISFRDNEKLLKALKRFEKELNKIHCTNQKSRKNLTKLIQSLEEIKKNSKNFLKTIENTRLNIPPSNNDVIPKCEPKDIESFLDPLVDGISEPLKALPEVGKENVTYNTKNTVKLGNHTVAICETTGTNKKGLCSMEDKSIAKTFNVKIGDHSCPILVTGVFDGHGGDLAANYAKKFYPAMLQKRLEQCNDLSSIWQVTNALTLTTVDLHESWCLYCDKKMKSLNQQNPPNIENRKNQLRSGTTAAILLKIGDGWYTANVGDSRILLVDSEGIVTQVTADATPENQEQEIKARGGELNIPKDRFYASTDNNDGPECGTGRTIGDAYMGDRERISDVAVNPRSTVRYLGNNISKDSFFCFFSDGVVEEKDQKTGKVGSSQQIGELIAQNKNESISFLTQCIARLSIIAGSYDNITVGIVKV